MKFALYTAICGANGDQLRPAINQPSGLRMVAFVDNIRPGETHREGWELREPNWPQKNRRRQARQHKCLPHLLFPEATHSLWIDGCYQPTQNVLTLVDHFLGENDLCTFEHCERNCIYQEVEACIRGKKDDPAVMRAQVARYREEQYPYNNGLAETTAVLRRHTPIMQQLNEMWWHEISTGSQRDQLSLDYVCWRLHVKYAQFEGYRPNNPHFKWRPHKA